jgi:succinate dehydrogenase/fumarate reductase flavoprotein subunit
VIGGGGSGLAAAVSAAEHGATVALFEKRPTLGGTTGIAVGSFTAAGTQMQQARGIADTVAAHAEDTAKFASPAIESHNNEPLRQYFLSQAAQTLAWLQGLGLSFYGPSPEPPNRVPRMHNVVPGAKAYIAALQFKLQQHQTAIHTSAAVCQLLKQSGRVTGIEVELKGKRTQFYARRAVILAAGDYAASAELIARFKGPLFAAVEGINPHADGDGHLLAEQAGAQLLNMHITYGPELRFVAPVKKAFQWLPAGGRSGRILGAIARNLPRWVIRAYIKRLLVTWQHPENALFEDGAILINQNG